MQSLENCCQAKGVIIQYNSEVASLDYDSTKYSLSIKSEDTIIESKYIINSFSNFLLWPSTWRR